jgi:hypothetical protein
MLTNKTKLQSNDHIVELYGHLREMIEEYCSVLANERNALENGESEKLIEYEKLDNAFATKMNAFGKCIAAWNGGHRQFPEDAPEFAGLKAAVDLLKVKIKTLVLENREICKTKMAIVNKEIKSASVKNRTRSPYEKPGDPSHIDISR